MKREIINTEAYQRLCSDLSRLVQKGREAALQALAEIRNQTYWAIGERLSRVKEMGEPRAASELIKNLVSDLEIDRSNLYRALQFYNAYPKGLPDSPQMRALPWAVHSGLLPIKDEDERAFYLQQAIEGAWSARVLRRAIKSNLYENEQSAGTGKKAARLERSLAHVFHYPAELLRVIDGDTILVRIDLGFETFRRETIRLRGIDTPELRTKEGKAARQFVVEALKTVKGLVVRTYKTDVYGRYVGDVFYDELLEDKDKIFARGQFLNQVLLDNNLARVAFWG
jgi:endonuclease YncB( thermonuclease family)